jgi:hypothetical protein
MGPLSKSLDGWHVHLDVCEADLSRFRNAMKDAENQFHSVASFGHDDGTSRRTWPRLVPRQLSPPPCNHAGMLLLSVAI